MDEPYPCLNKDKVNKGPWFGRLLRSNTNYLFDADIYKINNWFNTLTNNKIPVEKKLNLLLSEPYNIKGLNVGFITLMLYILNKNEHQIWFQGLHDGLKIINPDLESYTGKPEQYLRYNEASMNFAAKYSFDHTELDWIFSTGFPVMTGRVDKIEREHRKINPPSNLRSLQQEYWQNLKNYMEENRSSVRMRIARPKSWSDISLGRSDIYLAVGMNTQIQTTGYMAGYQRQQLKKLL